MLVTLSVEEAARWKSHAQVGRMCDKSGPWTAFESSASYGRKLDGLLEDIVESEAQYGSLAALSNSRVRSPQYTSFEFPLYYWNIGMMYEIQVTGTSWTIPKMLFGVSWS